MKENNSITKEKWKMGKDKYREISSPWNACVFKNHVNFISQGNWKHLNENILQRTVCSDLDNPTTTLAGQEKPSTKWASHRGRRRKSVEFKVEQARFFCSEPWTPNTTQCYYLPYHYGLNCAHSQIHVLKSSSPVSQNVTLLGNMIITYVIS